ncbi:oxidoreductase C-terminal domain-containing protein [Nocardioides convexus]|uniref:oxidoreductase C-terminal domain-containing protein n=1 Tax=Nocardioides convexus TaxID=2712224 RepID=UPI002418A34C|nr:oxidoreductase C-terminal domain-containing protein [Nocardioides convexus]
MSGDPTRDRDFTCYYLQQGRLLAVDCVNRPRDFMKAKQTIGQGLDFDRAQAPCPRRILRSHLLAPDARACRRVPAPNNANT